MSAPGFGADDYIAFDLGEGSESDVPEEKHATTVDDAVREHATARSTPWATDVEWHRYRNAAEMYVARLTQAERRGKDLLAVDLPYAGGARVSCDGDRAAAARAVLRVAGRRSTLVWVAGHAAVPAAGVRTLAHAATSTL